MSFDVENVADELEKLTRAVVDQAIASQSATTAEQLAQLETSVSQTLRGEIETSLRKLDHATPEPWTKGAAFPVSSLVMHKGGTWRCVVARGARENEEPGPNSVARAPASVGVSDISFKRGDGNRAAVVVKLSDGTEMKRVFELPGFEHKGSFSPDEVYRNGNVVHRDGATWLCTTPTSVGVDPRDGHGWRLLAQRGKPGAPATKKQLETMMKQLENGSNARSIYERLSMRETEAYGKRYI
jgi:hypothetical protein